MPNTPRNDPTWLEYMIVYIVLGVSGFFLYQSVLAPNGYTFSAGWAALRGKNKPAASQRAPQKQEEKTQDDSSSAAKTETGMNAQEPSAEPAMPPPPMAISVPEAMPAPAPMSLSEEDD